MKKIGLWCIFMFGLCCTQMYAQFTQSIIGTLVDKESKAPLQGAIITIVGSEPLITATSDLDGKFILKDLKYGKYDVQVTYIGYEPLLIPQVTVGAGKETNINLELTEVINNLKEATVVAKNDKDKPINDMSTVSVRTFSVEETQRYSASFNDPARMSLSFAGISTSNDASNEIIVRGNSSRGLLWRIEGIEIPNPNHFSSGEGSTGGGISILSSQVLDNSDFMTGAFSADYGNALSGVFDIKFRKGNYKKRHYAFQFGVLGAQVMLEGPFSKKYDGSYLINYRYSTLQLFNLLGLPIVDNGQVPVFQDLSFNFNFPIKKGGVLSFWGIGGNNTAGEIVVKDSLQWDERRDRFQDNRISWVAATGITHTYGFKNNHTYLKNTVSFSYENNAYGLDSADNNYVLQKAYNEKYIYYAIRSHSFINHKFNAQHTLRGGVYYSHLFFDIFSEGLRFDINQVATFFDDRGNGGLLQTYINWKYRINEKLEMVSGVHALFFLFNQSYNIEPRWAIKYRVHPKHSISLGAGIHSRIEPISTYMSRVQVDSVNYTQPNKNLGLSKSVHVVAGYDWAFYESFRLKAEAYFQYLYNVPIVNDSGSTLSALNLSSGYTDNTFINNGQGRNYGIELTVEKFLSKNYFFLFTASVFNSEYTMNDEVWRSTRFNGNYMFNWLGGNEIKFGKKKVHSIAINTRIIWRGGNKYNPIDLAASQAQGRQVELPGEAYTQKLPDYFRWDASVLLKFNFNKWAFGISLDVQNVLNRKNINSYVFDPYINNIRTNYMFGIMPVFNFKFEF
jgi:hypothetical protein